MHPRYAVLLGAVLSLGLSDPVAPTAEPGLLLPDLGVPGGLCVQVGGGDNDWAAGLAATGRFLVHVIEADEQVVTGACQRLDREGQCGRAAAERWDQRGRLPYAENVVNAVLLFRQPAAEPIKARELSRVLAPNGVVLAAPGTMTSVQLQDAGFLLLEKVPGRQGWLGAKKRWSAEMDQWPNPRHGADGNAVSRDLLVGPPRRVRWTAAGHTADYGGPVSAAGRNFYSGGFARDAFKGLRLWHREGVNPFAASEQYLFVGTKDGTSALDAVTGELVHRYEGRGWSRGAIHDDGTLIVFDHGSVRAYQAQAAKLLWDVRATKPRGVVATENSVAYLQGDPRSGVRSELIVLDRATGQPRWRRDEYPWLDKVANLD